MRACAVEARHDRSFRARAVMKATFPHDFDEPTPVSPDGKAAVPSDAQRRFAARIYRARREREGLLPRGLFSEPAWDMLLDLYVNDNGSGIATSSLCIASNVPATTALRWIQTLADRGLIERHTSDMDQRMTLICLSESGWRMMHDTISRMMRFEG